MEVLTLKPFSMEYRGCPLGYMARSFTDYVTKIS
jgi:hypothetical protein